MGESGNLIAMTLQVSRKHGYAGPFFQELPCGQSFPGYFYSALPMLALLSISAAVIAVIPFRSFPARGWLGAILGRKIVIIVGHPHRRRLLRLLSLLRPMVPSLLFGFLGHGTQGSQSLPSHWTSLSAEPQEVPELAFLLAFPVHGAQGRTRSGLPLALFWAQNPEGGILTEFLHVRAFCSPRSRR